MHQLTSGNKSIVVPFMIPSVSSYETQLDPVSALRLQTVLTEPVSLVSAYDIHNNEDLLSICATFSQNGILFLDSGGYESTRIAKYSKEYAPSWEFSDYERVVRKTNFNFVFSFDLFPQSYDVAEEDFTEKLINFIEEHRKFIEIEKLIPVVHFGPRNANGKGEEFNAAKAARIVSSIVGQFDIKIIAVTERELGDGILERARNVSTIKNAIIESGSECLLHILGCGNPLSFSILVEAGADVCDGLEWCRTSSASNLHLHHFQQADLFSVVNPEYNTQTEFVLSTTDDYYVRTSTINLHNFASFVRNVQSHIELKALDQFRADTFGVEIFQAA